MQSQIAGYQRRRGPRVAAVAAAAVFCCVARLPFLPPPGKRRAARARARRRRRRRRWSGRPAWLSLTPRRPAFCWLAGRPASVHFYASRGVRHCNYTINFLALVFSSRLRGHFGLQSVVPLVSRPSRYSPASAHDDLCERRGCRRGRRRCSVSPRRRRRAIRRRRRI